MSNFLKEWGESHRRGQYELQYVTLPDGSQKHVTEYKDISVSIDDYKNLKMNSYAQDLFVSKMCHQLLIKTAEEYMKHCKRYSYPASTYDEAIIHVLVPELIKRLKDNSYCLTE